MSKVQDIYKIRKQMKLNYKKYSLLEKKQKSFGLTAEEEEKLKLHRNEFWLLHEEMIDVHMGITVLPYVMNTDITTALKEIGNIIPWNGDSIKRDDILDEMINIYDRLNDEKKEIISEKLKFIHEQVLLNFESFCSSESGYIHMQTASKVLTSEEDGNILDVLIYLDRRYRDLAELFNIELEEVEILWED